MELFFKDRQKFRQWLKTKHDKESELWLVYYKKHTGEECISYNDAVEEALCFGWIDGKVKSLDDRQYMQRFTPRKPRSIWSKANKERCLKMIRERKMTKAGLKLIEDAKKSGWWEKAYHTTNKKVEIKSDFKKALKNNPEAERFFLSMTDSQKNQYLIYIDMAKQHQTKIRRMKRVIERLEKKLKPGMM